MEKKNKALLDLGLDDIDPVILTEELYIPMLMRDVMRCYTSLPDDGRYNNDSEALNCMLLKDGLYLLSLLFDFDIRAWEDDDQDEDEVPKILTQDNTLVRDILYVLENQLPLFALHDMLNFLVKFKTKERGQGYPRVYFLECIARSVEYLLQKQLYISKTARTPPREENTPSHLLHLVHYYFRRPQQQRSSTAQAPGDVLDPQGLTSSWRRATYYSKYADLRFKRREFGEDDERTILDIDLQGGTLCIPFLRVDSTTWTMLRNLMALEEQEEERPVTAYCYFMSQVACTAEDVELLQRARILEHFLGSDEQAARGFAQLCDGVDLDVHKLARTYLSSMLKELDKRCSMPVHNLKGLYGRSTAATCSSAWCSPWPHSSSSCR